jgi:hypothetical protein
VWLKRNTLLYSDAGVTPITDGGSIYRWGDSSGNGNHANQTNSSNRPVYSAANGWASFTSGSSHFMTITNAATIQWASGAPRSYIALMQLTATGSFPVISGKNANSDEFRFNSTSANPSYTTNGSVDTATSSTAVTTGQTAMVSAVQGTGDIRVYIGDTQVAQDASASAADNNNDITLGSRTGTTQFISMKLLEYLVLPSDVSTDNLALLKSYWGL